MKPTGRLLALAVLGIPLALVAALLHGRLWTVWLVWFAGLILLAGVDSLLMLPRRRLRATVEAPPELYMGEEARGTLQVAGRGWKRDVRLFALLELGHELTPIDGAWLTLTREPEGGVLASFTLPLQPRRRGQPAFVALHAKWHGPLGLIERRARVPLARHIAIVPNVAAVRAIALRMFGSNDFLAGLKVERFIGDGTEFESLREYSPGHDHRAIDWKASARHRKLLTQEFRAERNHQVVIAVDAGQLMAEPLANVPRLDHALNASLLLSWLCLRTGDRVGFASFDERLRSWHEPIAGNTAFPRMQRLTAEVDYRAVESNFTLSLTDLATRLKRRSLVVLFTEFLDTVTAELMIENVNRLARRHLVIFVALRDPAVESRQAMAPRTLQAMHEAVVATDFARERALVLERLRQAGVHCIDATPERFSMALLNRYLDVKRRELF